MKQKVTFIITGLLLSFITAQSQTWFGPQRIIISASTAAHGAMSVFATDIDGDGDEDVLSASRYDNKIAWYENIDGKGFFGSQIIISTDVKSARSVFATDIDGDGDMDILSASPGDNKIAWFENTDGKGSFNSQQIISTAAIGAKYVFATDIDGDGDMDVLSASEHDDKIAWYENTDGNGNFSPQQIITINAKGANSVYAIDIDGDGDMDVLSASKDDAKIAWYENMTPNSIETTPQNKISIYPNPTTGKVTLDFTENEIRKLSITDLTGKNLFEKTLAQAIETIDLSTLPGGIYILIIQTDKEIFTGKIVKE